MVRGLGGEYALEHFEVSFDEDGTQRGWVQMCIEFKGKPIWRKRIMIDGFSRGEGVVMSDEKLADIVSSTMKAHLDLVCQMHFARLDRMFPKAIQEVFMSFEPARNLKLINVKFKNGHVATGPESEAKLDVFHARCAMLYDLPPI